MTDESETTSLLREIRDNQRLQLERLAEALELQRNHFDAARKQELPYLPEVIGVVTSPSGAVIRDILHRLADRFPSHAELLVIKRRHRPNDER